MFRLDIYMGDVMYFNMEKIFPAELRRDWDQEVDIRIVANLPFNVSTPLIVKVSTTTKVFGSRMVKLSFYNNTSAIAAVKIICR